MGWRWWDNLRALSAIWCLNWDWLPFWVRRQSTHSLLLSTLPSRVSWSLIKFWLASDWHSDSTSGEDAKENSYLVFLSSKKCWVTLCGSLWGLFQAHIFNLSLFCVFVRGSDVNRPEHPEIHFGKPHLEAQSHTWRTLQWTAAGNVGWQTAPSLHLPHCKSYVCVCVCFCICIRESIGIRKERGKSIIKKGWKDNGQRRLLL